MTTRVDIRRQKVNLCKYIYIYIYIYIHIHTHTHTYEGESNENLKIFKLCLSLADVMVRGSHMKT